MIGLPAMRHGSGIKKRIQTTFGGYNHTAGAKDGDIYNMTNLTGDLYPVLSPRKPRYKRPSRLQSPRGFCCHDGMYWVNGKQFFADDTYKGDLSEPNTTMRTFASLGAYIIILPDKMYYNRLTGQLGDLESSTDEEGISCTIQDGTFAGEPAAANTIDGGSGFNWATYFNEGDSVTISGATTHTENNQTLVVQEIDGRYLRFYENSFVINEGGDSESSLVVKRGVPDMDFICENENRLWGCKGDSIFASKLGDPFNWYDYSGIATCSYAVDVGSEGDFTGCASYLGYPCFFKEEHIYKVYGDRPSNYQVMGSATLGIEKGSHLSPAIAGEVMYYLSRAGIVAYSGGIPQLISAPFGTDRYKNAVGGSDGVRYYVSMQDMNNAWHLFVYDTRHGLWFREDGKQVIGFGWNGELYFLDADGYVWLHGNARSVPQGWTAESTVQSVAEFADFVEENKYGSGPNKKGTAKIQIRIELDAGASVKIDMQFDSDGVWREVKPLSTNVKRSYYLPIIPRRSDHFRIRFTGTGAWRLHSLVRENYSGSEL